MFPSKDCIWCHCEWAVCVTLKAQQQVISEKRKKIVNILTAKRSQEGGSYKGYFI